MPRAKRTAANTRSAKQGGSATSGALGYLPQGSADPGRGEAQNKNLLVSGVKVTSQVGVKEGVIRLSDFHTIGDDVIRIGPRAE